MKRKDVINQFGESAFDGKVKGYIGICILQALVFVLCMAIGIVVFYFLNASFEMVLVEEEVITIAEDKILYLVAGVVAVYFFLFVGAAWAECISLRWTFKHTVISGYRLYFDGKSIQLFGNCLKWFFLTVVTLGIYSLFLFVRYKQWEVKHTKIDNSVENANIGNNTTDFVCPPVYVQPMMPQYPNYPQNSFSCPYRNAHK